MAFIISTRYCWLLSLLVCLNLLLASASSLAAAAALSSDPDETTTRLERVSLRVQKNRVGNSINKRRATSTTTALDNGKSKNQAKFMDSLNGKINDLVGEVTLLGKKSRRCGCRECRENVWNARAPANADEWFSTCGRRVEYLEETGGYSHRDACRAIAGYDGEFPEECGRCDPDRCDGRGDGRGDKGTPNDNNNNNPDKSPKLAERTRSLYCFPPYEHRMRWTNVWDDGYTVEVKGGQSGDYCGPGNNKFSTNTVSLDTNNDQLKLKFQRFGASWEGSEVRIILPENKMPYTYGTYRFVVGSVSVIDSPTGSIVSKALPVDLVLGLFTWDTTENYATHENWNHEVDIEISRWGKFGNADGQFLIQPPGQPDEYRFFTGKKVSRPLSPGSNTYEFTWNPTSIMWSTTAGAGGGESFTHSTEDTLRRNMRDDIQCLPANVEVRINLWNRLGSQRPVDMTDNQHVEVTIQKFSFIPSNIDGIADGQVCSKTCQCQGASQCIGNRCAA